MSAHFVRVTVVSVSELVGHCCTDCTIITVILHRIWMHIWHVTNILWCVVRAEIRRFKLIVSDSVYNHTSCIICQCQYQKKEALVATKATGFYKSFLNRHDTFPLG